MRSRAESALMIDQALAAPVLCALAPIHVSKPGCVESRATGSHDHLSAPVRASNARTTPLGAAARLPSATDDPTITRPLMIAGGEVTAYSPLPGSLKTPWPSRTCPPVPKSL